MPGWIVQILGVGIKRTALQSEKKGVPINAKGYLESKERKTQKSPSQISGANRLSIQVEVGGKEYFVVFPEDHVDLQVVTGGGESPVVVNLHPDEGRDVEFLFEPVFRFPGGFGIGVIPQESLGVAFAPWGVCDLRHQGMGLGLLLVPRVVESHRVETVAEGPEVSEYGNRAGDRGVRLFGHGFSDRIFKAGNLGYVVILPVE